jgi:hypothetical protein
MVPKLYFSLEGNIPMLRYSQPLNHQSAPRSAGVTVVVAGFDYAFDLYNDGDFVMLPAEPPYHLFGKPF